MATSGKKNVFIVGLDDFNLRMLQRLPEAKECNFHAALHTNEIRGLESFPIDELVERAASRMEQFPGTVDAVTTYYDFPGTDFVPILAERFGLRAPSLESIFRCEHKYWSRLEQQKVIPDHIPQFKAFDPFDPDAFTNLAMIPPFWIKPIKSFRSFLAYKINDETQFKAVMETVQKQIDYIVSPFAHLLDAYRMPREIAEMKERCLAESPLAGSQCTLEGYVYEGEVVIYGVVDSVREADRSSFSRYEYPSSLPQEIQFRMADVARRVVTGVGLDNSAFNMEFFYDPTHNQVLLLEINPRISQAHTDIFEKVHRFSHLRIMVNLALGRRPSPMEYHGPFRLAANCMLRTFESGRVTRIPTPEAIERLCAEIPGTHIKLHVREGQHLSELHGQDSYSYELANIFLGGRDQAEIIDKYDRCVRELDFAIERDEPTALY
jgi:hypothetical protein